MSLGIKTFPMDARPWDLRAGSYPVSWFEKAPRTWIVNHLRKRKEKAKSAIPDMG